MMKVPQPHALRIVALDLAGTSMDLASTRARTMKMAWRTSSSSC
jgi:hypothetical protein